MSTIKNIIDVYGTVQWSIELYGATEEFTKGFEQQRESFFEAMTVDFDLKSREEMAVLPDNTSLGVHTEQHLTELKKWLFQQSPEHFEAYGGG